jgi:hypothetical protein
MPRDREWCDLPTKDVRQYQKKSTALPRARCRPGEPMQEVVTFRPSFGIEAVSARPVIQVRIWI